MFKIRNEAADLVQELLDRKCESEDLDYKLVYDLTKSSGKKELAKDLAAFANTRGGHILVGVEDETFLPVGIKRSDLDLTLINQIASSIMSPVKIIAEYTPLSDNELLLISVEYDGLVHEIGPGKVPLRQGDTTCWADASKITMMKQQEIRIMTELEKIKRRRVAPPTTIKLDFESENDDMYDIIEADSDSGYFAFHGKPAKYNILHHFGPYHLQFWYLQDVKIDREVRVQVGADCQYSCQLKRGAIADYAGFQLQFVLVDADGYVVAYHELFHEYLSGLFGESEQVVEGELHLPSHYNLRSFGTDEEFIAKPNYPYEGGLLGLFGILHGGEIMDADGIGPFWIRVTEFEWAEY